MPPFASMLDLFVYLHIYLTFGCSVQCHAVQACYSVPILHQPTSPQCLRSIWNIELVMDDLQHIITSTWLWINQCAK